MRYLMLVLFAISSIGAWAQSGAWREDSGWFVGAVIGAGELDEKIVDHGDVISDNSDDRDITGGIVGGYQFNRFFGLEAGYHVFGEMTANDGFNRVDLDIQGFKMLGVGRVPLGERVALVGKAGVFHHLISESVHFENFTRNDNEWDISFALEAGVHFKFTPKLSGSIEAGYYNLSLLDFDWDDDYDWDDDDWWDGFNGLEREIVTVQVGFRYRF